MKFDACPVEPPGFGSGPLSSCRMSVQPRRARWHARPLPTMPAPMTTTRALLGRLLMALDISVGRGRAQLIYLRAGRARHRPGGTANASLACVRLSRHAVASAGV